MPEARPTDRSDVPPIEGGADTAAPAISLPKGGGAIRGIGETFAANPVTGTGTLTIPIATSPGRSGFGPRLALSYDSGGGNGPFGLGWRLSIPAITRKTDKGLPRYRDADESDVFLLAGAEDLVPVLREQDGRLVRRVDERDAGGVRYEVRPYRPRVDGLHARIERWTDPTTGVSHWRTISRDNVTRTFGRGPESRIADPATPDDPSRVYSWLLSESWDDRGNAIRYVYAREDAAGVDPASVHERSRLGGSAFAERHPKRIVYGNRSPRQPGEDLAQRPADAWMFEVVFDYDEGHVEELPDDERGRRFVAAHAEPTRSWSVRQDPFSTYRAGFERRTYRLCRRVLMFHRFPAELGTAACLVRSTELAYRQGPLASFVTGVTQSGFVRQPDGRYLRRSMPSLDIEYTEATLDGTVHELSAASTENLPGGVAGPGQRWVDLDGEGLSGVLGEHAGCWSYKRNLGGGRLGPLETVATRPSMAADPAVPLRFMDLAGDGRIDLVQLGGPTPGFVERSDDGGWSPWLPFASAPRIDWDDPHLRVVDLTGDGRGDILLTEDAVHVWHPSRGERGFGPAERVAAALDGEPGPRLVATTPAEAVHVADLSGDGLADIVRIRNGEVCYWPNLGYGRFGARVTMGDAPRFDTPDRFDARRIRLADVDGSGTTDLLYLGSDGTDLYANLSGNRWADVVRLPQGPDAAAHASATVVDLLGNGTACLVWSSPSPAEAVARVRYVDLLGGHKPHLLRAVRNNLGAETRIHYTSSTSFYVADRAAGRPWATRLPFPVHVVERVETFDRISGNRFCARYAYHHGYFDGAEREFRGFGMVEQWDTEEYAVFAADDPLPDTANLDEAAHLPPVLTRTWFHAGAHDPGGRIRRRFEAETYREPDLDDTQHAAQLLPDAVLPPGLTVAEQRQATRALKGSMLRQEVYALDGTSRAGCPYTVSERSYTVRLEQRQAGNRAAVVQVDPAESREIHHERDPGDPRIAHQLTLEVDRFGNVVKSVAIGYGRRAARVTLDDPRDRAAQTTALLTYTENDLTAARSETAADLAVDDDVHRTPRSAGSRSYELTGYTPSADHGRFTRADFVTDAGGTAELVCDGEVAYEAEPGSGRRRRLIEHVRTLYRRDDLDGVLPHKTMGRRALPHRSYRLAFTPGLLAQLYGDRVSASMLTDEGRYVDLDGDGHYWIPSGTQFYAPDPDPAPVDELAHARQHFFVPVRFETPLGGVTVATYDDHDLLLCRTEDALGNAVSAVHDYRVLKPLRMTGANGNQTQVAFDALGRAVGTAVMGKPGDGFGDDLAGFEPEPDQAQLDGFFADPLGNAAALLGNATTRVVYDLARFARSGDAPGFVALVDREAHVGQASAPGADRIRVGVTYSDGFGREIQRKAQAGPGPLDPADPDGATVSPRWVGSGRAVFDNKGNPVRKYEPFFSASHDFEPAFHGTSSVLLRDPLGRVVAVLHPDHTYDKTVFDAWRQQSWDANDTIHPDHRFDPRDGVLPDPQVRPTDDPDVGALLARRSEDEYWPTWYARRMDPAARLAAWPDLDGDGTPLPHNAHVRDAERRAAEAAARHAATPTVVHLDSLGRTFVSFSDNGRDDTGADRMLASRVELDIEGNVRAARDALGRTVATTGYDMLGSPRVQRSMDAGERRNLANVAGLALYSWDQRGHRSRQAYDTLHRPTELYLRTDDGPEIVVGRTVYGESEPDPEARNLRGRIYRTHDGAGVVTNLGYDPHGNLLGSRRQLLQDPGATPDWDLAPSLEAGGFEDSTRYDALNRATQIVAPHGDGPGDTLDVIQPTYDEAGMLRAVDLWQDRVAIPHGPLDPSTADLRVVEDVRYDARGQRLGIVYGNGVATEYGYDPDTFRLLHLRTRRAAAAPGQRQVQDLRYTYDPVGNIQSVRDDAQPTIYFDNAVVEPHSAYVYDALYQLIRAEGREHPGHDGGGASSWDDAARCDLPHPHDGAAMRRYAESYRYDDAGNLLSMVHAANGGSWTRAFAHDEPSPLRPGETSNRLTSTTVGVASEVYPYDAHGNALALPHLSAMAWDHEDRLVRTERQATGAGVSPERTLYAYDAGGARIRKVTERANGTRRLERIQLGSVEITRRYDADGALAVQRNALHVMDDTRRVALVETRVAGDDGSPARLVRYGLDDHLGSAVVELDGQGAVVSYEEFHPYGSTAYQAVDRTIRAAAKRYRFCGKERDEETGLYYHGARYYAPWLGRWTAADPAGLVDGLNLFAYARGNPVMLRDPSGTENVPATAADRRIMMMNDTQLHLHLKGMSAEARASFAGGATGWFARRAWATLNRGGMAIGYQLPEVQIRAKPPRPKPPPASPPTATHAGGASLPNVEHPDAWLPPAVVRGVWDTLIDNTSNSGNPWYSRAASGVGTLLWAAPTGVEMVVHGVIAAPQLAVTETIAAGEHLTRAALLAGRGSTSAAVDEVLAGAQAGAEGVTYTALTVLTVEGGVKAVKPRAGKPAGSQSSAADPHATTQRPTAGEALTERPAVGEALTERPAIGEALTEPAPPPSRPPSRPADPHGATELPPPDPLGPTEFPPLPKTNPADLGIPKPPRLPTNVTPKKTYGTIDW